MTSHLAGERQVDVAAREWVRERHDMSRIAGEVEALLKEATSSASPVAR
jgi:hypothetical protein